MVAVWWNNHDLCFEIYFLICLTFSPRYSIIFFFFLAIHCLRELGQLFRMCVQYAQVVFGIFWTLYFPFLTPSDLVAYRTHWNITVLPQKVLGTFTFLIGVFEDRKAFVTQVHGSHVVQRQVCGTGFTSTTLTVVAVLIERIISHKHSPPKWCLFNNI